MSETRGRGARPHESTKRLEEEFLEARKLYDSFEAMGEAYNISPGHIRRYVVTRVAEKLGVPRETFLFVPGRGNFTGNGGPHTATKPINMQVFWEKWKKGLQAMKQTQKILRQIMEG